MEAKLATNLHARVAHSGPITPVPSGGKGPVAHHEVGIHGQDDQRCCGRAASSEKCIAATSGAELLSNESDGLLSPMLLVVPGVLVSASTLEIFLSSFFCILFCVEAFCAGTGRAGWLWVQQLSCSAMAFGLGLSDPIGDPSSFLSTMGLPSACNLRGQHDLTVKIHDGKS